MMDRWTKYISNEPMPHRYNSLDLVNNGKIVGNISIGIAIGNFIISSI